MGWYFTRCSREELIRELIEPRETENGSADVIAHSVCDNVLWSVLRVTAKQPGYMNLAAGQSCSYICCALLDQHGGEWGYKPMEESMHPYYYNCPLAYLDMAPVQCPEWREQVRTYHRSRAAREPAPVIGGDSVRAQ